MNKPIVELGHGRFSRGIMDGLDIPTHDQVEGIVRKANLNKASLRKKEYELRSKLNTLLGREVHVRFRHVRAGERVMTGNNPPTFSSISDRGDFTFASIDMEGGEIFIGAARCSPHDQFNRVYGRVKAMKRLIQLLTEGENTRWGLVITHDEQPATGWTIGAVQRLRLKQHYLDGMISYEDFCEAEDRVFPFVKPREVKKTEQPTETPAS